MKFTVLVTAIMLVAASSNGCGAKNSASHPFTAETSDPVTYEKPISNDKIHALPHIREGDELLPLIQSAKCVIRVDFSSHGAGIDKDLEGKVLDFIADTETIHKAFMQPSGKEGEVSYCLDVDRNVNNIRVFQNLKKVVEDAGGARKGNIDLQVVVDF